jgi:hypothetical protein
MTSLIQVLASAGDLCLLSGSAAPDILNNAHQPPGEGKTDQGGAAGSYARIAPI